MKRKIAAVIAVTLAIAMFSGCKKDDDPIYGGKSREEVIDMCNNLMSQLDTVQAQYNDLLDLYNGIQSEQKPTAAISMMSDGSSRYTFNSVDGKIVFPKPFEYPNSEFTPGNGAVSIVQGVSIQPTPNWTFKISSSTMTLEHTDGISGTIKVAKQNYLYTSEQLQNEIFPDFFKELPASSIVYSNIAINSAKLGCQAVSPTLIDGEKAFIRCGMLGLDNKCVTYTFVYKGDQDVTKDESITSLLNSMQINGATILIEQ